MASRSARLPDRINCPGSGQASLPSFNPRATCSLAFDLTNEESPKGRKTHRSQPEKCWRVGCRHPERRPEAPATSGYAAYANTRSRLGCQEVVLLRCASGCLPANSHQLRLLSWVNHSSHGWRAQTRLRAPAMGLSRCDSRARRPTAREPTAPTRHRVSRLPDRRASNAVAANDKVHDLGVGVVQIRVAGKPE